jgi:hypothetical protein
MIIFGLLLTTFETSSILEAAGAVLKIGSNEPPLGNLAGPIP